MHEPGQDDALDLSPHVGVCLDCGQRRVLCAFGECHPCHHTRRKALWRVPRAESHGHLCCGWWGSLSVLPWQCLTCNSVVAKVCLSP